MPRDVLDFLGPERARAVIERQLRVERDRCHQAAFAANFARSCPVDGAREEDYQQSLWMCDGALVLTGIRFKGGRIDAPFVDLLATTASWAEPERMSAVLDAVFERYKVFSPRSVRVLGEVAPPALDEASWVVAMDQVIVVGDPTTMATAHDVTLTPVEDLSAASDFVQFAYDELFAAHPDMEEMLCPASFEALEQCDHVYWIGDRDHVRCGVLATEHAYGPMACGQCVIEEVVARPFRGQRLASGAQRALAQVLVESGVDQLIWGTIDAKNTPSRRTALRAGRQEVAAWHWISRS